MVANSGRGRYLAAVDIGSNSFHLILAEITAKGSRILERARQKVQLGRYLDDNLEIVTEGFDKSEVCLQNFNNIIAKYNPGKIAAVATNTVRVATNKDIFINKASSWLGFPIEVVTGEREAELIYKGAVNANFISGKNLIIDIGGGSTEIIVGCENNISSLHSFSVGCVNMTRKFANSLASFDFTPLQDYLENLFTPLRADFSVDSWDNCRGCSGTVQAVCEVLQAHAAFDNIITLNNIKTIEKSIIETKDLAKLPGLWVERQDIFLAGFIILSTIFKVFQIKEMQLSKGALREGLLWELCNIR